MARRSWPAWLMLTVLCSLSLPVFAKDNASKPRSKPQKEAPSLVSVSSATHPEVKHESRAAGSVLRIAGKSFGESSDTRVVLHAAGIEDGIDLTVLTWKDQEILVKLPSVSELGIDADTAAALSKELSRERPMVSMNVSIELLRGSTRVLEPIAQRVALAAIDFDQDGAEVKQDPNDLDPAVR